MNFEIKFTPEAIETYDALAEPLREHWGDKFVIKLENRISKCLATIATTPYIYPVTLEHTGTRKCVLHKNCSMFYNVFYHTIHTAWFWDNRQDPIFIL